MAYLFNENGVFIACLLNPVTSSQKKADTALKAGRLFLIR
jgi:hypothetical protein